MRQKSNLPLYEAVRDKIAVGDVIAFSGKGRVSEIIKYVARWHSDGEYSHVGIVLDVEMGPGAGKSVMIIESTTLVDLPDAVDRSVNVGVQLHWLSKRLAVYDGKAAWLQQRSPINAIGKELMLKWLRETHDKKVPYDHCQAIGAGIDFWDRLFPNARDYSALFCSELVTRALQLAGKVGQEVNPSETEPWEVVRFPCFHKPVIIKE